MSLSGRVIDRRSFIKGAAPFAVALPVAARAQIVERARFGIDDVPLARQRLLEMVNAARLNQGLGQLQLDNFACTVADQHAADMVDRRFLSHWGSDGRKPYHRYSFAGGTDALQENVGSVDNAASMTPLGVEGELVEIHRTMSDELPPNDGHRRTILFPYHTHVAFGIAAESYSIRLDEIYIARYVKVDPLDRRAKPRTRIRFSGKLLDPKLTIYAAYVYHEPLPSPPPLDWLRMPRSYSLPDTFQEVLPKLPEHYFYEDGSKGVMQTGSQGNFQTPITLHPQPGINTIVLWIRRTEKEPPFPATQVCIRCE